MILMKYSDVSTAFAISKRYQYLRDQYFGKYATVLKRWYNIYKYSRHVPRLGIKYDDCGCDSHNCTIRRYVYLYDMKYFRTFPELALNKVNVSDKTIEIYNGLNKEPVLRKLSDLRKFIQSMSVDDICGTGW